MSRQFIPLRSFFKDIQTSKRLREQQKLYHVELKQEVKNILMDYDTINAIAGDHARILQSRDDYFILTRSLTHVYHFATFTVLSNNQIKVKIEEYSLGFNLDDQSWAQKFKVQNITDYHGFDEPGKRTMLVYLETTDDLRQFLNDMEPWFNQPSWRDIHR